MQMTSNGTCSFCPENMFSDGHSTCQECPVSTAPETGLFFEWWNNLPEVSGFSTSCLTIAGEFLPPLPLTEISIQCNLGSLPDDGCEGTNNAWQPAMDYIKSSSGFADDSYLVLSLDIDGFKGDKRTASKATPIAQVSFIFETSCADKCSLFFMQVSSLTQALIPPRC